MTSPTPGKKRILILGATGATGVLFCKKALSRGHSLSIFARSPDKLPDEIKSNASVKLVSGSLTDSTALSALVKDQDIVVSTLGPNAISLDSTVFAAAYRTILKAMKAHGVTRILALGTISLHDAKNDKFSLSASLSVGAVRTAARAAYKSIIAIGEVFSDSELTDGLDWTLFRVPGLANGKETKGGPIVTYIGASDYSATVNRSDIAAWLVEQVESETLNHVGAMPVLCSPGSSMFSWRPGMNIKLFDSSASTSTSGSTPTAPTVDTQNAIKDTSASSAAQPAAP